MSISYSGSQIQVLDDNGDPVSGAKINFYEPGTTTRKDTYTDSTKSVVNTNPVICDANGRAQVWLSGAYKVVTTDSADVAIGDTIDNYNASTTVTNEGVLVLNGSFENDTVISGQPDNWIVSPGAGGTIAVDSTDQAHGLQSLKFTGTDATGGGTATSNKFNVLENGNLDVRYSYKSSSATTTNKLQVKWYDSTGAVVSTTDVFNLSTGNPTTWTNYVSAITVPSTAIQAEVILTGAEIDAASTLFDAISISEITEKGGVETGTLTFSTVSAASTATAQTVTHSLGTDDVDFGCSVYTDSSVVVEKTTWATGKIVGIDGRSMTTGQEGSGTAGSPVISSLPLTGKIKASVFNNDPSNARTITMLYWIRKR